MMESTRANRTALMFFETSRPRKTPRPEIIWHRCHHSKIRMVLDNAPRIICRAKLTKSRCCVGPRQRDFVFSKGQHELDMPSRFPGTQPIPPNYTPQTEFQKLWNRFGRYYGRKMREQFWRFW